MQVLLVFLNSDPVAEALHKAAEKLNFEVTICNSCDSALEDFQSKSHDLVIIDTRNTKTPDYETLCRSVEETVNLYLLPELLHHYWPAFIQAGDE